MTNKSKKPRNFLIMPQYPGGNQAMRKFITDNLRYPDEALELAIEGEVHIKFSVSNEGTIEDVEILKGLGHGCDEEAKRLIHLLKYEPAHNRGAKVRSSLRTRINFKLPGAPAPVINYNVTPKKEKPAEETTGSNVYGYTITINNPS